MKKFLAAGLLCLSAAGCASAPFTATSVMSLEEMYKNPAIPRKQAVAGDSHKDYLPKLAGIAERRGIVVMEGEIENPEDPDQVIWGFFDRKHSEIAVDSRLTKNEQVVALVHELAHALGPQMGDEDERDVVAQAVACIVCQRLKLDAVNATMAYYTANQAFEVKVLKTLARYAKAIDATAALILTELGR